MECSSVIHPFQNDPGVSQRQRVMDDLLSGAAKIDGRSLADLLDYFVQLSRHVNYYDPQMKVTDWQPFFQSSLPFTLSAILKYDRNKVNDKLAFYNNLFDKRPGKASLQLLFNYIYHTVIRPLNTWSTKFRNSGLPIELLLDKLIKDKLTDPLKVFIVHLNAGVKWYQLKALDFNELLDNEVWDLDITDTYANFDAAAFAAKGATKRKRLIALRNEMVGLVASFLDAIQLIEGTADLSMEQSLFPLKEELKEKHTPHLALLFSFLKLFQHLQGDLNSFSKKHLDFFYKEVLALKPKGAKPDQAHLVFEIQNQLDKYLLKKGLLVKDGKDSNKTEILFALDEEIVVNKTQVAEQRTLFLNNQIHGDDTFVEGLYIAPDATKADGLSKDFKEVPASWPTLGAQHSKYIDPEHKFVKPYPNARLGFMLASPVLLLNEGTRTVNITLSCNLLDDCCSFLMTETGTGNPCCEEHATPGTGAASKSKSPHFYAATALYHKVRAALNQVYYEVNRDLIAAAWKKGISKELKAALDQILIKDPIPGKEKLCYCPVDTLLFEKTLTEADFFKAVPDVGERKMLAEIFKPMKALNVLFSGEKEWISPAEVPLIKLSPLNLGNDGAFKINITATLLPEQKAVTFYNAEALKEDFDTTMPVLKIELNDKVKWKQDVQWSSQEECCEKKSKEQFQQVSLYHFFRNVKIAADDQTKIQVQVCGLKNFIVQNDESVQNVNGPVYPFGTRPEVIDFDIKHPLNPPFTTNANLIGPNFYIGSKEVFCKKWDNIYINLDWKDKPTDFRDYYKGYLKDGALFGLDVNKFLINLSILENGKWKGEATHGNATTVEVEILSKKYNDRRLFANDGKFSSCTPANPFQQTIHLEPSFFGLDQKFVVDNKPFVKYGVDSFNGFIRLNLQNQDFCHKVYSYVLARQMMALGRPKDDKLEDAIYYDVNNGNLIVFSTNDIKNDLLAAGVTANRVESRVNDNPDGIKSKIGPHGDGPINNPNAEDIREIVYAPTLLHLSDKNLTGDVTTLKNQIAAISTVIAGNDQFQAVIPAEPWTPVLKNMSLDYTATATIKDIDLIHLYPYQHTYKPEELELQPALFPTFCEEGTLFIGLKDLQPGSTLNMLFQLAEATADSESERVDVQWYYLENNSWKALRKGFEVLEDDTDALTTSGIIKFALPANMSKENTILPKGLHWIKVAIPYSSKSVSETMAIYTQAIRATFTNDDANDKLRLAQPLSSGALSKLNEADASVKKLSQPFDSFAGRVSEGEGHFYTRVSELLRHKGRAIQKFDYERLALEAFPQLFKVKCINHSFALNAHRYLNDMPMAPGYVLLAVIPDLNQLKAAQQFEPRVPVSLLEEIQEYLKQRNSPFARLRVMNPRYEKVNFCLKVKLYPGKDEHFYKEKLREDLRLFLAPWAIGEFDKLSFGQCVNQSDLLGFLETRDYLDYIMELKMQHEEDGGAIVNAEQKSICPISPRSILIAGDIDVCILQQDCETWGNSKAYPPCENRPVPIGDYCKDQINFRPNS